MKTLTALRRLLHNTDRLEAIDEGVVNLARDFNKRLDKLIELQQAQLVMERDLVEAIDKLVAVVEVRR
jgi:hypothetical protein